MCVTFCNYLIILLIILYSIERKKATRMVLFFVKFDEIICVISEFIKQLLWKRSNLRYHIIS